MARQRDPNVNWAYVFISLLVILVCSLIAPPLSLYWKIIGTVWPSLGGKFKPGCICASITLVSVEQNRRQDIQLTCFSSCCRFPRRCIIQLQVRRKVLLFDPGPDTGQGLLCGRLPGLLFRRRPLQGSLGLKFKYRDVWVLQDGSLR